MGLAWEERAQLKSMMYVHLLNKHQELPMFIKTKTVKIIVDIARLDWPHFYPDYFTNVLQLSQKPETCNLGLLFLLTTTEELVSPREDISVQRKTELKKLLLNNVPHVFSILSDFLNNEDFIKNHIDCSLVLKTFSHFFSWVPASQVPRAVVDRLFQLAGVTENEELSMLSLCTLNEMLYRNWIPPNWDEFFENACTLLKNILFHSLDRLEPSYMEKLSDFLRLLLGVHISHLELNQRLPLDELLSAILTYTVRQHTLQPGFISCLEIWTHIMENQSCNRYSHWLFNLAQEVLNKIQFRQNHSKLEEFDNKIQDDNKETDWQKFLKVCIEVIAKVAEFEPLKMLYLVFEKWAELCNMYSEISTLVEFSTAPQDLHALHCILRDLCSFTQAIGRLCPYCTGPNWEEESRFNMAQLILKHLLTLSNLSMKLSNCSIPDFLKGDIQNVHAEVLASLKSWCYWIPLLYESDGKKMLLNDLVSSIVDSSVTLLLQTSTPEVLQHCSAHLLLTLTSTVRPKCLWDFELYKCLYTYDLSRFHKEDQYLIHGSLINSLVLPWPKVEDQLWDQRLKLLNNYMSDLTNTFIRLPLEYNDQYKNIILSVLQLLQYIIQSYKSEGTKPKKLLCISIQKAVEHSLALFPIYVRDPDINQEILAFFLILLECLQQQVGVTFTQVTVQTFMDVYTREQLQSSLAHESGGGLQQLLQILDLVVQTPGLGNTKVTPVAVNLCLQLAEHTLCDQVSPSVQESFFELINSILLHKWHYFSKATIETETRSQEFLFMLKTIGRSLLLPDINMFKQNLKNLERLNNKWKLYHKDIFRKDLVEEFLTVLFNCLIKKTHTLLNEDIAVAIFNMISVDFNRFHTDFLPLYIDSTGMIDASQKTILLKNFSRETDLPSVTQNIFRFSNDLICYQLCNSSFPSGSIQL